MRLCLFLMVILGGILMFVLKNDKNNKIIMHFNDKNME